MAGLLGSSFFDVGLSTGNLTERWSSICSPLILPENPFMPDLNHAITSDDAVNDRGRHIVTSEETAWAFHGAGQFAALLLEREEPRIAEDR